VAHGPRQAGALLAFGRTFIRTIAATTPGPGGAAAELEVVALSSVCTRVDCRGRGLGGKVVAAAFREVTEGAGRGGPKCCLFDTGVPEFYERLGAAVIPPAVSVFADMSAYNARSGGARQDYRDVEEAGALRATSAVMIYPASALSQWPAGSELDLLGDGW
jgi:hypothetical protein